MVSKGLEMLQKHKSELERSRDILSEKISGLKKELGMADAGKLENAAQDAVVEKATLTSTKMRERTKVYIDQSPAKSIEEYCHNLKVAVRELLKEVRNSIDTGSDCEDGTLLGWYCRLPGIIKECEAADGIYSSRDATRICLLKCERIFGLLLKDTDDPERWAWVRRYLGLAPPGDASLEAIDAYNQATSLSPQNPWVQAFWERKLCEKYAIDLHLVEFIYTVDCKECTCDSLDECEAKQNEEDRIEAEKGGAYVKENKIKHRKKPATPKNTEAHGWNAAPWAVVNWALRVANVPNTNPGTVAICEETLACYQPFIERLEEALYLLPQSRRVVFRGVGVPGISKNYSKGTKIVLAPFSSTSLVGAQALGFMRGGGCFFVFIVSEAGSIEPASWYPEQAESLLNTFAQFEVKRKLSRTLLRMIGVQYDVVSAIQTIPGAPQPSDEQIVDAVIREATHVTFLFEKYLASYVQAQLTSEADSSDTTGIYTMMDQFVRSSVQCMLLVGSAGSGKTSATLAATSHLNSKHSDTVYPLFISLPSVVNVCKDAGALDRHILELLDLSEAQFKVLLRTRKVVLLLDSFDECRSICKEAFNGAWIVKNNPLSGACKLILSVRDEAFPAYDLQPDACEILPKAETVTRYVAPFTDADMRSFIIVQATKTKSVAEAKDLMGSICDLRFPGAKELRLHPITLSMLVQLALAEKMEGTTTKGDVYQRFVQLAIPEKDLAGLQSIAVEMLKNNSWQITVDEVRAHLPDCDLTALPARVEDQTEPLSFFSFWHRSIGEFLAALAVNVNAETSMESFTDVSFSKRCPSVALFYGSIATTKSCAHLEKLVGDSASSAATVSNALSLLRKMKHHVMNVNLSGVTVTHCDLTGGDLGSSSLENVTLKECWVEGLRVLDCTACNGLNIDEASCSGNVVTARFATVVSKTPFYSLPTTQMVISFHDTHFDVWDARGYYLSTIQHKTTEGLAAKFIASQVTPSHDGQFVFVLSKEVKAFKNDAGEDISAKLVAKFSVVDGALIAEVQVPKEITKLYSVGDFLIAEKPLNKNSPCFDCYSAQTLSIIHQVPNTEDSAYAEVLSSKNGKAVFHFAGGAHQTKLLFSSSCKEQGVVVGTIDVTTGDIKRKQLQADAMTASITPPVPYNSGDMILLAVDTTFHVVDSSRLNTIQSQNWTEKKVVSIDALFPVVRASLGDDTKPKEELFVAVRTAVTPKRKDKSLLEVPLTAEMKLLFNQDSTGEGWGVDVTLHCVSGTSQGGVALRTDNKNGFVHLLPARSEAPGKYGDSLGAAGVPSVCFAELDKDGKLSSGKTKQKPSYPGITDTTFPDGAVQ